MKHHRLVVRTAAVVVPLALVLGSTTSAFAAKPPRTPVPTVTDKPAKVSSSTSATFTWADAASATAYSCSLDGSTYSSCTSPKSYSNLTDRAHTFALRAKLASPANAKPSTYSYGWTVDTVAPAAPVVSPIAGPTSNTSASVSFTDADASVVGFTCALDGAAAVACTSPYGYSSLSEQQHTVVVSALDAAGNAATGSVSWVVDHTAPNIPVVVGPANPTNNPDASVSFTGDGDTYTCKLDGEDAAPCTSPWTRPGLAEGSHTLTVTPFDLVPNAGTPGTATWVVDTTPPGAPALVSAPAVLTNDPDFTVRFSGDLSTSSYLCTFAAVTAPCTSPFTPVVTPVNGAYSLSVRAVDQAGNQSDATTTSWTFDSTAPAPAEFVSGPATPTNAVNPTFDFIDTDTSTDHFTCQLDALAVLDPCVAGVALAALPGGTSVADGAHSMSVVAVDGASNASAPVLWHWVQDTSGPVSQPNGTGGVPASSGSVTSTPTFTFTNPDPTTVAGFVCSLDGGPWLPCASGFQPNVGDGSHTLQIATVDQAGNIGGILSYSWTLDTTAPLGVLAFPATLAGAPKVTFGENVLGVSPSTVRLLVAGTASAVATVQSCLDATAHTVSCSGPVRAVVLNHATRLVPGQRYQFSVNPAVHDAAGNPASAPATVYRALRVLQESELAVVQAWSPKSSTAAYGGRYLQARLPGAAVAYTYTGTSVTWYTATGPLMGTARVYCGSTLKATVNNYAATAKWRVPRTVTCSTTSKRNVLKVVATGLKGNKLGKGTQVVVDAVKVGAVLTTNPVLTQRWGTAPWSLASGGRYAVADQVNESFSVTFRGTSVAWRSMMSRSMGKAKVYVDGVYKGTVDQFATTTKVGTRTWKLTDKVHTLKIVLTGTHRSGATGTKVVVDALVIG
jgi:hypothetical protein